VLSCLAGIGSGTFIPLTIAFVIRCLPAQLVVYGIAVYAMNSEVSQNVAASLEGWYVNHLSWEWVYWQYCVALPFMFVAIWFGVPRERINVSLWHELDWPGLTYAWVEFAMLYAGLEARLEGERTDYRAPGGRRHPDRRVRRARADDTPSVPELLLLLRGSLLLLLLVLAGFRLIILSTSFLQTVQNVRELQMGQVLVWIALPQLVIAFPLAALRVTSRAG
jgi:DHA2 family multidrug resistance protein